MGSKGIKPRKPRRRLPRLKRMRIEDPTSGHVAWPPKGSGFEASPYSPAGYLQRMWIFSSNLRRSRQRVPLWPLVGVPLAGAP